MLDFGNVWGQFVSLQVSQGLLLLVAPAMVVLTARLLGPEQYGSLTLFLVLAQFMFLFGVQWSSNAVVRFGQEEQRQHGSVREVFWTRLLIAAGGVAITAAAAHLVRQPVASYIGLRPSDLALAYMMVLAWALGSHALVSLQAVGLMQRYAVVLLTDKVAYLGLLAVLAWAGGLISVPAVVVLMVVGKLAQFVLGGLFLGPRHWFPPAATWRMARRVLGYSWPLLPMFTVGYLAVLLEPVLIKWYRSAEELGAYQAALQGSSFLVSLLTNTVPVLAFPMVTAFRLHERRDLLARYLTRLLPQITLAWASLISLLVALSGPLFWLAFGARFMEGVTPFIILLVGAGFQGAVALYSPVLAAHDLTKEISLVNILEMVIQLVAYLTLIPLLGIAGAALGWLACYAFGACAYAVILDQRLGLKSYSTLGWLAIPFPVAVAGLLSEDLVMRLGVAILAVSAALAAAKRQGVFRPEDLALLEQLKMPPPVRKAVGTVYHLLS